MNLSKLEKFVEIILEIINKKNLVLWILLIVRSMKELLANYKVIQIVLSMLLILY